MGIILEEFDNVLEVGRYFFNPVGLRDAIDLIFVDIGNEVEASPMCTKVCWVKTLWGTPSP